MHRTAWPVDTAGNIYVGDSGNYTSLKGAMVVSQTVPVVTWLAPSAITYWNNNLTTRTGQFRQTILDSPSA
jgi:hypothetical protein